VSATALAAVDASELGKTDAVTVEFFATEPGSALDPAGLVERCTSRGVDVFAAGSYRSSRDWIGRDVRAGVTGIALIGATGPSAVLEVETVLGDRERQLELEPGSLEVIPIVTNASAVWNVDTLVRCSTRIRQVVLDEFALCAEYGVSHCAEPVDPCTYARGRVITEATSAQVQPVACPCPGISLSIGEASGEDYMRAVKNLGFKGMIVTSLAEADRANQGFTPAPEELEHWRQVRDVFEASVAGGRAAVKLAGQMIDIPVYKRAQTVLALGEATMIRDQAKRRARLEAEALG
jgi:citrate lyase subunit beta/citryl-CoA lyase